MITKRTVLNEAQLELLDLVSVMDSKEEIEGLRKVITDYLGAQLKKNLTDFGRTEHSMKKK